jgi:hypothetical protein
LNTRLEHYLKIYPFGGRNKSLGCLKVVETVVEYPTSTSAWMTALYLKITCMFGIDRYWARKKFLLA